MNPKVLFSDALVFVVSDYFPLYAGERDASTTLLFYTCLEATLCIASFLFTVSLSFPSLFSTHVTM